MSVLKRLLPYIILNVIVSAAATFAVLTWWNSGRPTGPVSGVILPPEATATASLPDATPIPADVQVVEITNIVGTGSVNIEVVTLQRVGDGELHMDGWRLEDSSGHRFIFPDIVLYKGGTVHVFTRAGSNSVNELFWGLSEAVWKSGKTISLFDNHGILRATLVVP